MPSGSEPIISMTPMTPNEDDSFENLPQHLAIIMDGNGRWAKARDQARVQGHRRGVDAARRAATLCGEAGIPYLTLFAFSSENWRRPDEEVHFLTQLLALSLEKELGRLHENGVRLNIIGDPTSFGRKLAKTIDSAVEKTSSNTNLTLTIALNYGARQELLTAVRRLADSCVANDISPQAISESDLEGALNTRGLPDPISLSAREVSSASATSCCGSSLTPSCSLAMCCGRTSMKRFLGCHRSLSAPTTKIWPDRGANRL